MKYLKLPSYERLHELFEYNSETGELKHKTNKGPKVIGDNATYLNDQNYFCIGIDYKRYRVHRVVYKMYHNLEDDEKQIDHINGITTDNRICNLRLVEQSINQKNKHIYSNNTSGYVGVYHIYNKYWIAKVHHKGNAIACGCFKTKQEAINARKKAERLIGFTNRHGKKRVKNSN